MQSLAEGARQVGLSMSRLRVLCEQARVPGAEKVGRFWVLPDEVKIVPVVRRAPTRRTPK